MSREATQARRPIYRVHPSVLLLQKWEEGLKAKSGRSLGEWIELIGREGPQGEADRRAWLKQEHGLGTNAAAWIAERADGRGLEDGDPEAYLRSADGLVDAMFTGTRAGLRPLYETLLAIGLDLGEDVHASPCKTIVPLYRNRVFSEIKPAARTRIDLGLALGDRPVEGRLIDTGGFAKKDRITHRIPVAKAEDIDDEVRRWMRLAYDLDE